MTGKHDRTSTYFGLKSFIFVSALICLLCAFWAPLASGAEVTRGPYLQKGTPTSVVVRWRTDAESDSRVRYGTDPGDLSMSVDDPAPTTEHELTLTGLSPDTKYYYSVGTTTETLAGEDADHFLVTPPAEGTSKPTRIWVIGDSGTADADARAVRDAYLDFTGTRYTDLWLMLGDNAYNDGTDAQHQAAVFDMYPSLLRQTVLWPTLGNHDGHTADSATQTGPYYDIFTLPAQGEAGGLASGTEAYYSFDYGNVHFICLESFETDRSAEGPMMTWLENDLASTAAQWVIAFWHHPPYSKGSHNSDVERELIEMRANALPILERHGVDLVLTGHSHSYERSFLLHGHYGRSDTLTGAMKKDGGDGRTDGDGAYEKPTPGPASQEGAVYAVAGSSGKTAGGPLNHPAMFISLNVLGSMVLDVDGNRLDAVFLDSTGAVRDRFSVIKEPQAAGLTGEYFDDPDFTNRTLTRTDAGVDFDWGEGSPDPSLEADTFSVRWTGQVQPRHSEDYTFYTTSDDGVRLWVNGEPLIDNWTDHGATEDSGTITLAAGQKYDIVMEFYENGGDALARLSWSSPSQEKEIIPQSQLYPDTQGGDATVSRSEGSIGPAR